MNKKDHEWEQTSKEGNRWKCRDCGMEVITTGEKPPARLEERGSACYDCLPDRALCEKAWAELEAIAVSVLH